MLFFRLVNCYLGFMLMLISGYFVVSGYSFYFSSNVVFLEWEIFSLLGSNIIMTILLDWMSLTFMGFVLLISSMVLFYSGNYMEGDKFIYRFIMLVYLFVISMLLLIMSPNMISILLGWDGLGLVSYCLVIYYQNVKSANAGMLTILSNRVGDVAILLSISWMANYGTWNFYFLQLVYSDAELMFILCMVVIAAMTKSAQIPFSAWLPAAMAAPTPVSALVHSSTLVTAGVYLLIRFSELLSVSNFMFLVGVFTMFMSGLGANFETDLKKIIALSTLSQLGVMMMILSLGSSELAFFHLLSHALFKSLLFLCAGSFIHSMGDTQDIRNLGGLEVGLPISSFYFMGCSLSLCGFPFLSGFYSKDSILEFYFLNNMNFFMFLVIVLGTMFTVTYSVRLVYYLFFKNLGSKSFLHLGESIIMVVPMSVLFILAISAGSAMSWLYFPVNFVILPFFFKLLIITLVLMLMGVVYLFMKMNYLYGVVKVKALIHFLGSMWFMPMISTTFIMPVLKSGNTLLKYLDQGWMEYIFSQGKIAKTLDSGFLYSDKSFFFNLKMYLLFFFLIFFYFMIIYV
uniref:NADH-ubiquinone oxidoreductase chain 5 n=1 Tax=Salina celebensis TaxID=1588069 RepID=A0A6G6A4J8_9HEXA|nr:NADH dehydrogenase subunit 5 [Salina celebensis]QID03180.1 NADH dehydrogenase subunit 5 [Salina celebensis]